MVITPELMSHESHSQVQGPKTQGGPLLRASLSYLLSACSVPCREAEEPVPRPDTATMGGREGCGTCYHCLSDQAEALKQAKACKKKQRRRQRLSKQGGSKQQKPRKHKQPIVRYSNQSQKAGRKMVGGNVETTPEGTKEKKVIQ